jgi:hypothetical protein
MDAERIADETARRLLARAAVLDDSHFTLEQIRTAALEAGISHAAFDDAVAEWRRSSVSGSGATDKPGLAAQVLRNAAGLASAWVAVAALVGVVRLTGAPWLVHKLTAPVGLAVGALVAAKLRARPATILLGGLTVSQAAEFAMDLMSGAPAIHGFGAHVALMLAGVAGVALGFRLRRPSDGVRVGDCDDASVNGADDIGVASRTVRDANAETDTRFSALLRVHRNSAVLRPQLG